MKFSVDNNRLSFQAKYVEYTRIVMNTPLVHILSYQEYGNANAHLHTRYTDFAHFIIITNNLRATVSHVLHSIRN